MFDDMVAANPPAGAGPFKVTVWVKLPPPTMLVFGVTDRRLAEATLKLSLPLVPPPSGGVVTVTEIVAVVVSMLAGTVNTIDVGVTDVGFIVVDPKFT